MHGEKKRTYITIDLKSFYASVECVEAGRNPLTCNLVVADASRTDKTICLAVSPSLKSLGISGRPRLFEVRQTIRRINEKRRRSAGNAGFAGTSDDIGELNANPMLDVGFITAPPRMALYERYSMNVFKTYLKYVSPDDIHIYSIDEVFIDATDYLGIYGTSPVGFTEMLLKEVFASTGITATAGIAENLYLSKIAMDIIAKKAKPGENGERMAELSVRGYREKLWTHKPLTDFWRIGPGCAGRLGKYGIYTMGAIARCSLTNEKLLYDLFGVNAELLIDHAWGYESCAMKDIKSYSSARHSITSGQVLPEPYNHADARKIVGEMSEGIAFDLLKKGLAANSLELTVNYDGECLDPEKSGKVYCGETESDRYGRKVPKPSHGTQRFRGYTDSESVIREAALALYDRISDSNLLVRRMSLGAGDVREKNRVTGSTHDCGDSLFDDDKLMETERKKESIRKMHVRISEKFGKNSLLKCSDLEKGSTKAKRNSQIGGHKA